MKRWIKRIVTILLALSVVIVLILAQEKEKKLSANSPIIDLLIHDDMALINESELLQHLRSAQLFHEGMLNAELDISAIEQFINELNEIEKAEVYKVIGNDWYIRAEVRRPIARIVPGREDGFYIDSRGKPLALTSRFIAHVPVFTGLDQLKTKEILQAALINNDSLITNTILGDIYRISNYVCNDAFYNAQIVQIHFDLEHGFIFIPRVGKHEIIFGRAANREEVEQKFKKLTTFYQEVIPYEGWDKYSSINLKFEKQIVAKKK
jgi:cell division protein FtsQ